MSSWMCPGWVLTGYESASSCPLLRPWWRRIFSTSSICEQTTLLRAYRNALARLESIDHGNTPFLFGVLPNYSVFLCL